MRRGQLHLPEQRLRRRDSAASDSPLPATAPWARPIYSRRWSTGILGNAKANWAGSDSNRRLTDYESVDPDAQGAENAQVAKSNANTAAHSAARSSAKAASQALPTGLIAPNSDAIADPDLVAVIDAWPALPDALKTGILAIVTAANGDRQET